MRKRWYVGLAMVFAAAIVVCGQGRMVWAGESGENKSLSLLLNTMQEDQYEEALARFREEYPEVELVVEVYNESETGLLQGMNQTYTELMAGKGPDLLLGYNYGIGDIYKMMKAQVYAPLDTFMEADENWNEDDYVKAVLESGRFGGSQYVMPLTYEAYLAVTSEEAMQAAGISEEDCGDTLSFMYAVSELYGTDYSERILADGGQLADFPMILGKEFLDYEEGEIAVDSRILEEACHAYAAMYEEDLNYSDVFAEEGYFGLGTAIAERRAYFYIPTGIGGGLSASAAIAASETPKLLPLRNSEGEAMGRIMAYAGIRANSENKQNAWNLLRILMSEEVQKKQTKLMTNCPVSKGALDEKIREELSWIAAERKENAGIGTLSDEFLDEYRKCLTELQNCVYVSEVCVNEFYSDMVPFYEGEESYEECIETFRDYASIYLTE